MTDWTSLRPGHFDRDLLPQPGKSAAGQDSLFTDADIADIAETRPRLDGQPAPVLEGQADLFGEV